MNQALPGKIAFWLSLPLSGVQGLWLRRTAPRLPEAAGDRCGEVGRGETLRLLAMGDSIIAGVGLKKITDALPVQFATALAKTRGCRVEWQLEAKNGADICHLRNAVSQLDDGRAADVILISIGVNNVTGLTGQRQWRTRFKALLSDLRSRWPNASVIFTGLPPMEKFPLPPQPLRFTLGFRAGVLDRIAAELLSDQQNMVHIPIDIDPGQHSFCADGFHPSEQSCKFWAMELAQRTEADNLSPQN